MSAFVSPEAVIEGDEPLPQAGVIAYRIRRGEVQVLLMTSRDTGRWIIPKGNIKPGASPSKAAVQEAFEEAGIKGTIVSSTPFGMYTYYKKVGSGEVRAAAVEVFLLQVKEQLSLAWPARDPRACVRTRDRSKSQMRNLSSALWVRGKPAGASRVARNCSDGLVGHWGSCLGCGLQPLDLKTGRLLLLLQRSPPTTAGAV